MRSLPTAANPSPVAQVVLHEAPSYAAPSLGRLPRLAPPLGIRPDFTPPTELLTRAQSRHR